MANKFSFERYIWFHSRLKKGKYPKLAELAARFEISLRQAAREIDFMRNFFSAPIEYSSERNGYFYSEEGFELPGMWITQEEIVSLVIARRLSATIPDPALKKRFDGYLQKISGYADFTSADLEHKISLKNIHYYKVMPGIFEPCLFALIQERKLHILYHALHRNETIARTISPLHLLLYLGNWHLIAYCHHRQELRDFVLARIQELEVLPDTIATEIKKIAVREMIDTHYGIFLHGQIKHVALRFRGTSAALVRDQVWFPGQQIAEAEGGAIILRFPVADFREVVGDILRFGSDAEVLEPPALRQEIKAAIASLAKLYSS